MELNKFVTLWIFSLCLAEKCWTDKTSPCSPEIQVVENEVSGKLLIILVMCERSLHLCFVYSPVEFSDEAPLVGEECITVSDSAGTICSPAENSPAGSSFLQPSFKTT